MVIETEFNCNGHFGFGNGVSLVRTGNQAYCNTCPISKACWKKHHLTHVSVIAADTLCGRDTEKDETARRQSFFRR
jgi:hypothetical protein